MVRGQQLNMHVWISVYNTHSCTLYYFLLLMGREGTVPSPFPPCKFAPDLFNGCSTYLHFKTGVLNYSTSCMLGSQRRKKNHSTKVGDCHHTVNPSSWSDDWKLWHKNHFLDSISTRVAHDIKNHHYQKLSTSYLYRAPEPPKFARGATKPFWEPGGGGAPILRPNLAKDEHV